MIEFDLLISKLAQRLNTPLPGMLAHEPMRARPLGNLPKFEHLAPPKSGSVLILLYPGVDSYFFPLIKRPDYGGTHSGQISLPGGKTEEGEDYIQTALREAKEEIGIDISDVKVIGRLSEFFVIPSNFMVTPVVAVTDHKPIFIPDTYEVVRVLQGNLKELVRDEAIKTKEILAANRYPMIAPHFEIEGEIVWGATAMMLNEFRMILKRIKGIT